VTSQQVSHCRQCQCDMITSVTLSTVSMWHHNKCHIVDSVNVTSQQVSHCRQCQCDIITSVTLSTVSMWQTTLSHYCYVILSHAQCCHLQHVYMTPENTKHRKLLSRALNSLYICKQYEPCKVLKSQIIHRECPYKKMRPTCCNSHWLLWLNQNIWCRTMSIFFKI